MTTARAPVPPIFDAFFWGFFGTSFSKTWRHLGSPGPPKKDLKWSENLIFWRYVFHDNFYSIFYWFLDAQTPRIVAPVEAKRYFLQNRHFRQKLKKWPNFHPFRRLKSMKNRSKIATRNLFAFWNAFFRIFMNFGRFWPPKKGSQSAAPLVGAQACQNKDLGH